MLVCFASSHSAIRRSRSVVPSCGAFGDVVVSLAALMVVYSMQNMQPIATMLFLDANLAWSIIVLVGCCLCGLCNWCSKFRSLLWLRILVSLLEGLLRDI